MNKIDKIEKNLYYFPHSTVMAYALSVFVLKKYEKDNFTINSTQFIIIIYLFFS